MAQGGGMFLATVPEMNFDWIPKATQAYSEQKRLGDLKRTLADLDMNDSESVDRVSRDLLGTGKPAEMTVGLKLQDTLRQRQQMERDAENRKTLIQGMNEDTPAPQARGIQGPYPIPPQEGGPMVGSTPEINRPEVMPSARVWGDREAEAAGLYPPRQQVAQAPAPPLGVVPSSPEEQRLQTRRNNLSRFQLIAKTPGEQQGLKSKIEDIDRQLGARQKEVEQRRGSELQMGEAEYKEDIGLRKDIFTESQKNATAAQKSDHVLALAEKLIQDPNTVTGKGTQSYFQLTGTLLTAADIARSWGIPAPSRETLAGMTDQQQKYEQLQSLANQITHARAGELSKGFSEGDRVFTEKEGIAAGDKSKEANLANIATHKAMNSYVKGLHKVVADYQRRPPGKKNAGELSQLMAKYSEDNALFVDKNGKETPLARQIIEAKKAEAEATMGKATPAARGSNEGRPVVGPDGKRYIFRGGQLVPAGNGL